MTWNDFTGKNFTREGFAARMDALRWDGAFKPQGIILHNTAAPSLAQWAETGDRHIQRIANLKSYYQGLGWHSGPHWFISRNHITEFMNPTTRGTHSPSFNATHFGIEMVGDYDREEFNSGDGALVRDNAVFVMAYLCKRFGWDPARAIKLHKEDPKTTHACPGKKVVKADVVDAVRRAMDGYQPVDNVARRAMAQFIVDLEARRDAQGRLQVYQLPAGDGGGTYEVAGINDRFHPEEAAALRDLIQAGGYEVAEERARQYILKTTDKAEDWTNDPCLEFMFRDMIHHRGETGAARILQRALGVAVDGIVGPKTLMAISNYSVPDLLLKLRAAREEYEIATFGKRAQFWKGFIARWDNALRKAQSFGEALETAQPAKRGVYDRGDKGDADIRDLQRLLGFSDDEIDGHFGPMTEKAVRWFQRRSGLTADGVVGPDTWEKLES